MSKTRIPAEMRRRVAEQARHRCGFCLTATWIVGVRMQVDHIYPEADGGKTEDDNLWLACGECNGHKSDRVTVTDPETNELVRLFHPRRQAWADHFRWTEAGDEVIGLTPVGRATARALQLNREHLVVARRMWVSAGWHPPKDEPTAG